MFNKEPDLLLSCFIDCMIKITDKTCLQGFSLLNLPAGICLLTCLQELLEIGLYLKINSGLIYIGNEQAFLIK